VTSAEEKKLHNLKSPSKPSGGYLTPIVSSESKTHPMSYPSLGRKWRELGRLAITTSISASKASYSSVIRGSFVHILLRTCSQLRLERSPAPLYDRDNGVRIHRIYLTFLSFAGAAAARFAAHSLRFRSSGTIPRSVKSFNRV